MPPRRPRVVTLTAAERAVEQAMCVLLEGVCGANPSEISRETGLSRTAVHNFLDGDRRFRTSAEARDALAEFIWRRLNAHLLLTDEDRRPSA